MSLTVVSQILGYLACAVTIICLQQKELLKMLRLSVLSNLLAGVSNVLIPGGVSGAGVSFVAVVQALCSVVCEKKGRKVPLWLSAIFVAGYIGIGVVTYKTPLDIIPCVAALMYAAAVMQKDPFVYRICILINALLWIYYEIRVHNYALLVTVVLQFAAAVTGIIRTDIIGRKREAEKTE